MTFPITINVTGDLHLHGADLTPVINQLTHMETVMTQSFATVDDALAALQAQADEHATAQAASRAAFDALAADVRAFLAALPPAGGALTEEQSAAAQAILDSLTTATAAETQEAADAAALEAEVPTE